ncbi:MAG: hypothetical protein Q4B09_11110 [Lachnospiraceae bacterium]|nr:hypothetical protein [Lachnospiraceae bacterium]
MLNTITSPLHSGRRTLYTVISGILFFAVLLAFRNVAFFSSDEGELFYKGFAMANGRLLYRDLVSQHMPFPYYLAALFASFGVHTAAGFRLCFYAVLALLWAVMFFRYAAAFSPLTAVLYPLLYCGLISTIENGNTILADQFQAVGCAILLFELLLFFRTRKVTPASCVYLSLGIYISLMSGFSSSFMIFAAGVTVLLIEITDAHRNHMGISSFIMAFLKKYLLLAVIVAAPLVLTLLYLKSQGLLAYLYQYAFRFNTEVYSKYYPNGYGSSFFAGLFAGVNPIANAVSFGGFSSQAILRIVSVGFAGCLLFDEFGRSASCKNTVFCEDAVSSEDTVSSGNAAVSGTLGGLPAAAGLLLFIIASATRGGFEFHGIPFLAVLAVSGSMVITKHLPDLRNWCGGKTLRRLALVLAVCAFFSSYLRLFPNIFIRSTTQYIRTDSDAYALDLLTDPLEEIGFTSYDHELLLQAGVLTATSFTGSTPWFWEWGRDRCLTELNEKMPRVYVYDSSLNVWNYKVSVYAPEIAQFLAEHYVNLKEFGHSIIYVRKDYYADACAILDDASFFRAEADGDAALPEVKNGGSFSEAFTVPADTEIAGVTLLLHIVDSADETAVLTLTLEDQTEGTSVILGEISLSDWQSGAAKSISFDRTALTAGHSCRLTFSVKGSDALRVIPAKGAATAGENFKAFIGDEQAAGNLALTISKARDRVILLAENS